MGANPAETVVRRALGAEPASPGHRATGTPVRDGGATASHAEPWTLQHHGHALPVDAVAWLPASSATVDALRAAGADAAGHACPRCGGSDHGRPWARAGGTPIAASASRAGAHLVVVTREGSTPIGIDVESRAAAVDPAVVLHASEDGVDPLWAWVAKEAIVKHLGSGLRIDPGGIRLAHFAVHRIPAPPGFVAAVCTGRVAP